MLLKDGKMFCVSTESEYRHYKKHDPQILVNILSFERIVDQYHSILFRIEKGFDNLHHLSQLIQVMSFSLGERKSRNKR